MKKWIFLLYLLVGGGAALWAQDKILDDVKLIPQHASQLCWAACMEMVMQYYDPTGASSQCDISYEYLTVRNNTSSVSVGCTDVCSAACGIAPNGGCNSFIIANYYFTSRLSRSAYFDIVFSNLGYHSMEDVNLLNWEQYKNEIDACRPVIFIYDATGELSPDDAQEDRHYFDHVFVGTGYQTIPDPDGGDDVEYIYVKDPWYICQGDSFLVNKVVLEGAVNEEPVNGTGNILEVNEILSSVHHIFPKSETDGSICDEIPESFDNPPAPENDLLTQIREYQKEFVGTRFGDQFRRSRMEEAEYRLHYQTPIEYISSNKIRDKENKGQTLNALLVDADIREITFVVGDQPLQATVRCSRKSDFCIVERIGFGRKDDFRQVVLRDGTRIDLSAKVDDNTTRGIPQTNYSIVRYPELNFEFYRFQYKGETYVYPSDNYTRYYLFSPKYQDVQFAVPESQVLKGLSKYLNDFVKLPDKDTAYREKIENRILRGRYIKIDRLLRKADYQLASKANISEIDFK